MDNYVLVHIFTGRVITRGTADHCISIKFKQLNPRAYEVRQAIWPTK